jgi:hypothetical protein
MNRHSYYGVASGQIHVQGGFSIGTQRNTDANRTLRVRTAPIEIELFEEKHSGFRNITPPQSGEL